MYNLWASHGKSEPEEMEEAEFYTDLLNSNHEISNNNSIKVYPNPAKDKVNINLKLSNSRNLKLDIYSVSGAFLETVYNGIISSNNHTIIWEPNNYNSGTYIMRFNFPEKSISRYMVIK